MTLLILILNVGLLLLLASYIVKKSPLHKSVTVTSLILKIACGIALGLIYQYYYNAGDTFSYFHDGQKIASIARYEFKRYILFLWHADPEVLNSLGLQLLEPRAIFFSKITSLLNILTDNNYWLIASYFSLLAYASALMLVNTISKYYSQCTWSAIVAFLFLPSVIFWSSGVIKESVAMASIYFLTASFLQFWNDHKLSPLKIVLCFICIWISWNLKYYFAGIFIIAVTTSILYQAIQIIFKLKHQYQNIIIWLMILVGPLVIVMQFHPNFNSYRLLKVICDNNQAYKNLSAPNDYIEFNSLTPDVGSIVENSPKALMSGLFRPFIWETNNILQIMVGIENLILLILFLFSLINIKRIFTSKHAVMFFALIVYVAILCVLITLATPNFGTLSRYRSGYLPFFVFLILINNPVMNKIERSLRNLAQ